MAAFASDFYVTRSRIFTRLAAIFLALRNYTATGDVCTRVLFQVGHH
jgi:hypothetical protein